MVLNDDPVYIRNSYSCRTQCVLLWLRLLCIFLPSYSAFLNYWHPPQPGTWFRTVASSTPTKHLRLTITLAVFFSAFNAEVLSCPISARMTVTEAPEISDDFHSAPQSTEWRSIFNLSIIISICPTL